MEFMRVNSEGKASPKREFKSRNRSQSFKRNLLESIARAANGGSGGSGTNVTQSNDDGVVRVKVLVRKQDLKQMLEQIRDGKTSSCQQQSSYSCIEQRLNVLRRRQLLRGTTIKGINRRGYWTPALQSIPEEL